MGIEQTIKERAPEGRKKLKLNFLRPSGACLFLLNLYPRLTSWATILRPFQGLCISFILHPSAFILAFSSLLFAFPLQNGVDGGDGYGVIGGACAAIDVGGALKALRGLDQFFIDRLEKFAAAHRGQKIFEPWIGSLVAVAYRHHQPLKLDLGIACARQVKGAVELGHALSQARLGQALEEVKPFLR